NKMNEDMTKKIIEIENDFMNAFNTCFDDYSKNFIDIQNELRYYGVIKKTTKEIEEFVKQWNAYINGKIKVMRIIDIHIRNKTTLKTIRDINFIFPNDLYYDTLNDIYTNKSQFIYIMSIMHELYKYLAETQYFNILIKRIHYKKIVFDNKQLIVELFRYLDYLLNNKSTTPKQSEQLIYANMLDKLKNQDEINDFLTNIVFTMTSIDKSKTKIQDWDNAYNTVDNYKDLNKNILLPIINIDFIQLDIDYSGFNHLIKDIENATGYNNMFI